jgi:hypothetical protein
MYSTHNAETGVPHLLQIARRCHIVPSLSAILFISIGRLCNADCALTNTVRIGYKNTVIMQGMQARTTGSWHLDLFYPSPLHGSHPLTMSSLQSSNNLMQEDARSILHLSKPTATAAFVHLHTCLAVISSAIPQALVASCHAALFSSALSTLVTAWAKRFLPQLLGLTLATLSKPTWTRFARISNPSSLPSLSSLPMSLSQQKYRTITLSASLAVTSVTQPLTSAMLLSSHHNPLVKLTWTQLASSLVY